MEIRQLEYFVEVAKNEHVSLAAENLNVAQSAVSRQVRLLEKELGIELFEREGRNVKLTIIGRLFLDQALIALQAIEDSKRLVEDYLDPELGIIRIGFPSSLANHLLPTVISAFKKEHPDVRFKLRQGSYMFLTEAIKNREVDIAFIGPAPMDDPDLHADVLFSEDMFALVPDTHQLAGEAHVSLNQLENESFILFPKGYILRKIAVDACHLAGFRPFIPYEGEDLDAIKGLVSSGIGVTLLPETTLYENTPSGTRKLLVKDPLVKRTVGVIIPKNRELSPSETLFYEFVRDFFSHKES